MEAHLRHLLDELNAAIGRSRPADRAELEELRSDVEDRLANSDPERHRHLVASLKRAEARLEVGHPRVAQAIQQALQSLSSAGI